MVISTPLPKRRHRYQPMMSPDARPHAPPFVAGCSPRPFSPNAHPPSVSPDGLPPARYVPICMSRIQNLHAHWSAERCGNQWICCKFSPKLMCTRCCFHRLTSYAALQRCMPESRYQDTNIIPGDIKCKRNHDFMFCGHSPQFENSRVN